MSQLDNFPILIANGQSLSAAVPLGADTLVGIVMPAAWTAAALTFLVSADGGASFQSLFNDAGTEVSVTVTAAEFVAIDPKYYRGANFIKVRSGTSATPVAQGADRALTLVGRVLSA
jgi:hypothetical protein